MIPVSSRARVCVPAAILLSITATACSRGPSPPTYEGANVLLITLDTLRADHLGAYGYERGETPRLDGVATEGIRFAEAISPIPLTLPSHTSLMTALDPYQHGVRDNAGFEMPADTWLLAESFQHAGYDTGAFVAAYVLHSRWGLARGFDLYDDSGVDGIWGAPLSRRGDVVVDAALPWLLKERSDPFFAWIHLYDPHAPYDAPEPWGARFADEPYDGEVAFTDSVVGHLLDEMKTAGLLDKTILLITADHGEDLEDHREPGHGLFLYDTTVHVPLLLRLPDHVAAGRVVDEQVRLIDVGPTILELAGLPVPDHLTGQSLAAFIVGAGSARPVYSETMFPRWHFGWSELHALRADGYKYIQAPRPELYDLRADPGETANLADDLFEVADAMRERLDALGAGVDDSARGEASGEAARRLRALGYIGTAPADLGDGPLPDPKDKVDLYAMMIASDSLASQERYDEAIAVLEQVMELDPRLVDAPASLGMLRARTGDPVGAEAALLQALELRPDYASVLAELGLVHRRLGDLARARADFEAVLALDPQNATSLFNLGELELEAGDPVSALRRFDHVLELYDAPVEPHFAAGVAAYELSDLRRASDEFELVADRAPDYPRVQYHRALLREASGDFAGAIALYREAVANDENDYRSLFNMAVLLIDKSGDHAAGIRALRAALRINPDLGRAQVYLGRSLVFVADPSTYPTAEAALLRGLQLDLPPTLQLMAHSTLAELYRRSGRPVEAAREQALADQLRRALQR